RAHGVRLDHKPPLPADFQTFDEWSPAPGATVLLCTKCYDNAAVLSRLPQPVTLVPIQNGFDPALAADGGAEGSASFASQCRPGRPHTRLPRRGPLHLGPRRGAHAGGHPPRLRELADRLRRAPFRVRLVPDILPYKYTKLMYNAAINPLAAATGLDNGQ